MSSDGTDYKRLWERIGRPAAAHELEGASFQVEEAIRAITEQTRCQGQDPTPEQVIEARVALNELRRLLEESIAPAAGVEPWGDPPPELPYGRLQDLYGQLQEIARCPSPDESDASEQTNPD